MIKAWHFTGEALRDGSPIPEIGKVLRHEGEIKMCVSGLHASRKIIDALWYAPGHMIHRVVCDVDVIEQYDKLVCRERTILWSVDGEDLLCRFARRCALDVIHLWGAPDVVRRYLETGDKSIRLVARDAARAAAWAAAWAAERRAAAWATAWAAALAASPAAALAASRSAAWAAERRAAAWAGETAVREKQNTLLEQLVREARNDTD